MIAPFVPNAERIDAGLKAVGSDRSVLPALDAVTRYKISMCKTSRILLIASSALWRSTINRISSAQIAGGEPPTLWPSMLFT